MMSSLFHVTRLTARHLAPNVEPLLSRRFFTTTASDPSVILTSRGAERIAQLQQKLGKSDLRLRLVVEGGGCSGFQYVFNTTSDPPSESDRIFSTDGAELLVDEESLEFVKGAKVDFTEDLIRRSFEVVDNPNVETGCGCGASFALKPDAGVGAASASSEF